MFTLTIKGQEIFDERTQEFIEPKTTTITLEHSLVSLSKWESKWCKPFLSDEEQNKKTNEEFIDYIRCMTLTQNVDPNIYMGLTKEDIEKIGEYINSPMSATKFYDIRSGFQNSHSANAGTPRKKIITSEQIYYWMILYGVPMECQKWHLNRLLTLIRVCAVEENKNNKGNKMNKFDTAKHYASMNRARHGKH